MKISTSITIGGSSLQEKPEIFVSQGAYEHLEIGARADSDNPEALNDDEEQMGGLLVYQCYHNKHRIEARTFANRQ